jgi:hypothetical protein
MTRDIDTVLGAYVECALWSSVDYPEEGDNGCPFSNWATVDDLAPETLEKMREDVAAFVAEADAVEGSAWWSDEQMGHDFWLTRNRHGAGFWDRHYNDTPEARAGDQLSDMARVYGECDLYTGDDGKVYAS